MIDSMIPDRVNQMSPSSSATLQISKCFICFTISSSNELSVANEKKWINKSQPSNVDSSLATNREFPPIQGSASLQFIQITHMMSMYNIFTDTCTRMGPDLLSALGRAKFNNYNENQMRDC